MVVPWEDGWKLTVIFNCSQSQPTSKSKQTTAIQVRLKTVDRTLFTHCTLTCLQVVKLVSERLSLDIPDNSELSFLELGNCYPPFFMLWPAIAQPPLVAKKPCHLFESEPAGVLDDSFVEDVLLATMNNL